MRKIFTILCLSFLMASQIAKAQQPDTKFESLRVAFITDYVQLTPDESQKFWPVYNQYRGELKSLRKQYMASDRDEEDPGFADRKIEYAQKKLDIQKKYRPQLEQVIGAKKYSLLLSAEDKFKQELLRNIQERKK